jgi:hypothetical protein
MEINLKKETSNKLIKRELKGLINKSGQTFEYILKQFCWDLNTTHLYDENNENNKLNDKLNDKITYYIFIKDNKIIGMLNGKTYIKGFAKNNIPKNWKNLFSNSDKIFIIKSSQKVYDTIHNRMETRLNNSIIKDNLNERLNKYKFNKIQNTSLEELKSIVHKLMEFPIVNHYDYCDDNKKLMNKIFDTWNTIILFKDEPNSNMYIKNVVKLIELKNKYLKA